MVYFYNQNQNHGYYDQPTHATGHSMATVAMVLGIGALTTCWTFYFTIFFGALAICFAVLSKGFEKKMLVTAKAGIICSVSGLVLAVLLLILSTIFLLNNPQALLDFGRSSDQMVQQLYGQSTESVLGFSYEDVMRQILRVFS